jgi:hypothetical protein
VLDLTNVKHLDSSGVGALFKLWVNAKKAECEFKVSNLNERIRGLLTTTNLSGRKGRPRTVRLLGRTTPGYRSGDSLTCLMRAT